MGAQPPVYSSVSGPAKWAAVIALSFACGSGLVYSVMREPRGTREKSPAVRVLPPRQVTAAPLPLVSPKTAPASPTVESPSEPAPQPADAPEIEPEREAEEPQATPEVATPVPEPEPAPAASVARKININKATQAELELLPRVGPATAKAILSYRALHGPFRSVQDLDKVKGIGPKTLEKLAPLVSVE